jgi:predicted CXXCH cytochrome family protein
MTGGCPKRRIGPLAVGFAVGVAASSLLLAQVIEAPADSPAAAEGPPVSTTQPAAGGLLLSGLIGSPHDFTDGGELGRDLCLPCHTPHLTDPPVPRFDRRVTSTQPLRPYQGLDVELEGWSLLCLGCHDGVTAQDVYSSSHGVSVAGQLGQSRLATTGLRSHPVGIKYPLIQENYHPREVVEAAGLILPNGCIQCTTCHDAHNTYGHAGMLRISNDRSRLCLTCHRL